MRTSYVVLDDVQRDEVERLYRGGSSMRQIAARLGCSTRPVKAELERRDVPIERSGAPLAGVRQDVFLRWTDDDAYWAGLLFADGCIHCGDHGATRVALALDYKDAEHVQDFLRFLGLDRPARRHRTMVRAAVRSDMLAVRLRAAGMTGVRTPSEELRTSRHFWRGMVDGDGTVMITGAGHVVLRLNGNPVVTQGFLDFARSIGIETDATVRPHSSIYRVQLSGKNARRMLEELYGDARVSLARKKKTAEEALS